MKREFTIKDDNLTGKSFSSLPVYSSNIVPSSFPNTFINQCYITNKQQLELIKNKEDEKVQQKSKTKSERKAKSHSDRLRMFHIEVSDDEDRSSEYSSDEELNDKEIDGIEPVAEQENIEQAITFSKVKTEEQEIKRAKSVPINPPKYRINHF